MNLKEIGIEAAKAAVAAGIMYLALYASGKFNCPVCEVVVCPKVEAKAPEVAKPAPVVEVKKK